MLGRLVAKYISTKDNRSSVDHRAPQGPRRPVAIPSDPEEISQVLHGELGGRDLQEVGEVVEVVQ